jgi:hypothetical protein
VQLEALIKGLGMVEEKVAGIVGLHREQFS